LLSPEAAVSLGRLVKDPSKTPFEMADDGLFPIDIQALTADGLKAAFSSSIDWSPEVTGDQFRLRGDALRKAAVMLALVQRETSQGTFEFDVLLTRRNASLREHSGQIAFPGGRVDATDASDEDAALREAFEEVGLPPDKVLILGQLNRYVTGTGFDIAPVVGIVKQPFVANLAEGEVAEMFQVPLAFLMNPQNHRRHVIEISVDSRRTFYSMQYQNYFIWGATAAMLRNFYRMLAARSK
jgi:8-oxo-dGTP pyrophosphatase MutT (NUDIX family)